MESVLEIATKPAPNTPEAGEQLRALRRQVRETRRARAGDRLRRARTRSRAGRTSGSPRASATATSSTALRFVARQELIFGLHVHVGIDDPDKAIHVANGMRVHVPVLLALSRQLAVLARRRDRPALDADADLPRLPARRHPARTTTTGTTTSAGSPSWSRAGVMEDYTWLWYDVPPAPEPRHGRDPRDGRADPRRAHARRSRR